MSDSGLGSAYAVYRMHFLAATAGMSCQEFRGQSQIATCGEFLKTVLTPSNKQKVIKFYKQCMSTGPGDMDINGLLTDIGFPVNEEALFVRLIVLRLMCYLWKLPLPACMSGFVGGGAKEKLGEVCPSKGNPERSFEERLMLVHKHLVDRLKPSLFKDLPPWQLTHTMGYLYISFEQHCDTKYFVDD